MNHLVLLGDSTLDNVVWTGKDTCIPTLLKQTLPETKVTNYAADGYTSENVLVGNPQSWLNSKD
jgi:hypothetical protein